MAFSTGVGPHADPVAAGRHCDHAVRGFSGVEAIVWEARFPGHPSSLVNGDMSAPEHTTSTNLARGVACA